MDRATCNSIFKSGVLDQMNETTCNSIFKSGVLDQMNETTLEIVTPEEVMSCFVFEDDTIMMELCRRYHGKGPKEDRILFIEMLKRFAFDKFYALVQSKRTTENTDMIHHVLYNVSQTELAAKIMCG